MRLPNGKTLFNVTLGNERWHVWARSRGHACRLAFRARIRADLEPILERCTSNSSRREAVREAEAEGRIYRTPKSDHETGLFEDVSCWAENEHVGRISCTGRQIYRLQAA